MRINPTSGINYMDLALRSAMGTVLSTSLYYAINDTQHISDTRQAKHEYGTIAAMGAILGVKLGVPLALLLGVKKHLDLQG